jgi:hypothetical protein
LRLLGHGRGGRLGCGLRDDDAKGHRGADSDGRKGNSRPATHRIFLFSVG